MFNSPAFERLKSLPAAFKFSDQQPISPETGKKKKDIKNYKNVKKSTTANTHNHTKCSKFYSCHLTADDLI